MLTFDGLPLDILHLIFEQKVLQQPDFLALSLTCKRLNPVASQHIYREVRLTLTHNFVRFCALLLANPTLVRYLRVMTIDPSMTESKSIDPEILKILFSMSTVRLDSLRLVYFGIKDLQTIAQALHSPRPAIHVVSLSITSGRSTPENEGDRERDRIALLPILRQLSNLHGLRDLSLLRIGSVTADEIIATLYLPKLTSLTIGRADTLSLVIPRNRLPRLRSIVYSVLSIPKRKRYGGRKSFPYHWASWSALMEDNVSFSVESEETERFLPICAAMIITHARRHRLDPFPLFKWLMTTYSKQGSKQLVLRGLLVKDRDMILRMISHVMPLKALGLNIYREDLHLSLPRSLTSLSLQLKNILPPEFIPNILKPLSALRDLEIRLRSDYIFQGRNSKIHCTSSPFYIPHAILSCITQDCKVIRMGGRRGEITYIWPGPVSSDGMAEIQAKMRKELPWECLWFKEITNWVDGTQVNVSIKFLKML